MAFLTICLFFVAALGAHYYEPLNKIPHHLMAMRSAVDSHHELTRKMALQDLGNCSTAFQLLDYFTNNSTCGANLALLWDNTTSDSVIDDYCARDSSDSNRTCADKLELLMVNVLVQCRMIWADNFTAIKDDVRKLLYVSKVPCVRNAQDHLCFKDFKHIGSVTNGTLTQAGLDSICTPCTAVIFGLMAQFAPVEFITIGAFIETACHKLNGEYCILKFQTWTNSSKPDDGDSPTPAQLDMICDPCVQTVLFRFAWLATWTNDTASAANLTKGLAWSAMVCQKDFSGDYCYTKLTNYFNTPNNELGACTNTLSNPSSCPGSSCQTAIRHFRTIQGCCAGTWFNMLEVQYQFDRANYNSTLSPDQMRQFAEGSCDVDIPSSCAKAKIVVTLALAGIDPAWAASHKQQLEDMVKVAIAYELAIDAALVLVKTSTSATPQSTHHLQATDPSLSFTVEVSTNTDAQTSRGVSNSNGKLSVLNSQLPAEALTDPTVGVTTQSAQISTVSNGDGNSACVRSPATLSVALLMVLVVLVMRV